jgi:hypothetical protein
MNRAHEGIARKSRAHALVVSVALVAVGAIGVIASGVACTSFSGTDQGAASDAATMMEAGSAGATEAGSVDGGTVAPSAADGGFCAMHTSPVVSFCDDFDESSRPDLTIGCPNDTFCWTVADEPGGKLTPDSFFSPPRAARFIAGPTAMTKRASDEITVAWPLDHPSFRVSLRIRPILPAAGDRVVGFGYGDCFFDQPVAGPIEDFCNGYHSYQNPPPSLSPGVWTFVQNTLARTSSGVQLTTQVGEGAAAIVKQATIPVSLEAGVPTSVDIELGHFGSDITGSDATLDFDDVLVEVE